MRYSLIQILFVFLVVLMLVLWIGVFQVASRCCVLTVWFFDVGQGDAIFIQTPTGRQILIDGGKDKEILDKLSRATPFFDRTIDIVIATHLERDHAGGLIEVLRRYSVETIGWNGTQRSNALGMAWEEHVRKAKYIFHAYAGNRIVIGKDITLDMLHPFEYVPKNKNSNLGSVVAKLRYGNSIFLLTGDIERKNEKELITRGVSLTADILKIAHHGSKSSSTSEFLAQVGPKLAVIQVGENNRYGHPHKEVLERLEKSGSRTLRTDRDGDIIVKSDGQSLQIKSTNY